MLAPLEQDTQHKCEIFYCDHRRDRYCCYYCWKKGICENPCLNDPDKCGKSFVSEEPKKQRIRCGNCIHAFQQDKFSGNVYCTLKDDDTKGISSKACDAYVDKRPALSNRKDR